MVIMGLATVMQFLCQVLYGSLVLHPLDQSASSSNPLISSLFAPAKTTGISTGFLLMNVSGLVQFIALGVVSTHAKIGEELDAGDIEDRKEREELLAEQQKMAAYGSQNGGPPAQATVFGQAPVEVHAAYGHAPPQMMTTHVVMQSDLTPPGFMPMPAPIQPSPMMQSDVTPPGFMPVPAPIQPSPLAPAF